MPNWRDEGRGWIFLTANPAYWPVPNDLVIVLGNAENWGIQWDAGKRNRGKNKDRFLKLIDKECDSNRIVDQT